MMLKQMHEQNLRLIIETDLHDNLKDLCLSCDVETLVKYDSLNQEWEYV